METKNDVIAKIYNLSAAILLGKATEEEIKNVSQLAKEHGCLDVLKDEISDCHRLLT